MLEIPIVTEWEAKQLNAARSPAAPKCLQWTLLARKARNAWVLATIP